MIGNSQANAYEVGFGANGIRLCPACKSEVSGEVVDYWELWDEHDPQMRWMYSIKCRCGVQLNAPPKPTVNEALDEALSIWNHVPSGDGSDTVRSRVAKQIKQTIIVGIGILLAGAVVPTIAIMLANM